MFGVYEDDEAAVDHVDCCGVERGREDDEEGLHDVWHQFRGGLRGEVAGCVADCHHWLMVSVMSCVREEGREDVLIDPITKAV